MEDKVDNCELKNLQEKEYVEDLQMRYEYYLELIEEFEN